ncbi:hypothetical protein L6452_38611 [Arctium lappa]|uniref:Uncharacterized protein n=1 Tax=Arctium lappa TaxID=4217 RepID=A0ACB8XQH6_ARCLA|nr:hypothetical protein L6452_38611 [Arctium lappa]
MIVSLLPRLRPQSTFQLEIKSTRVMSFSIRFPSAGIRFPSFEVYDFDFCFLWTICFSVNHRLLCSLTFRSLQSNSIGSSSSSGNKPLMIPHKTKRGVAALARLKVYEGVPTPYIRKKKRMVIADALKVLRLTVGHKYCLLDRLSSKVGWNHYETIKVLEKKRKENAQVVYERKNRRSNLTAKVEKVAEEKLGA